MKNSDFPLITEAWQKAEQFQSEAQRDQLVTLYRKPNPGSWRSSVAHFLVGLALRFDPSLRQSMQSLTRARACPKSR